ncbi:hypothetical protein ABIB49_003488 [Arthrobacter sp. UYCu512]|uniref:DUF6414 family protein n=1 Tax=Arthrobacter sp. UYCu512 TaxID=3156338 RepID=UPI0033925B70
MKANWKWWFWLLPWKWHPKHRRETAAPAPTVLPLREFVYLDEVSLKSLLVSQQGELATEFTDQDVLVEQAEVSSKMSVAPKGVGAEIGSRFQSTSTLGRQTLRKSVAQSQFKTLLEMESIDIRFRSNGLQDGPTSAEDLAQTDESAHSIHVDRLKRGDLMELEVELAADPIYRFNLTMAELSDLAKKYPEMTNAPGSAEVMEQIGPVSRMLEQLLVGLVPIRSRCLNLTLVEHNGQSYVARTSVAESLGLTTQPIDVVGVTDLDQYWKDVRRVLFAHGSFKMLCRVARDGLHDDWSPVKGAEVLSELAPQFPGLLEAAGRTEYRTPTDARVEKQREALAKALRLFASNLLDLSTPPRSWEECEGLDALISAQSDRASSASGQRAAFDAVAELVSQVVPVPPSPEQLQEFRQDAREVTQLRFSLSQIPAEAVESTQKPRGPEKLLDVEIVAIYW